MVLKRKNNLRLILLVILIVLVIITVLVSCNIGGNRTPTVEYDIDAGVAFLQTLEQQKVSDVDATLKFQRQQEILAERDTKMRQLRNGDITVWRLFDDYVILGDSRAVGFSFYGFLPENRVLAESGATIFTLEERIPEIVALAPANIFLCYGMNDLGYWATPNDYKNGYREIVEKIHAECPDSNIFLSSILPAKEPALSSDAIWSTVPAYSEAVSQMCDELSYCYYFDNTEISDEFSDQWESDGIHVMSSFYEYWAANMIMAVYDSTIDDVDNETNS